MAQDVWSGTINPTSTSGTELADLLDKFKDAFSSTFSGDTARPANILENGNWIKFNTPDDGILTWYVYDGTKDIEVMKINKTTASLILNGVENEFEVVKTSDDTTGALLKLQKNRITGNQTLDGDTLGEVQFLGQDASEVEYVVAEIKSVATDDVTSGSHGGYMAFYVVADGGTALVEAARFDSEGNLGLGVTVPTKKLETSTTATANAGEKHSIIGDNAVPVQRIIQKKRVSTNGQTVLDDVVSEEIHRGVDEIGNEIDLANISTKANENTTQTNQGSTVTIQNVTPGEAALSDAIVIDDQIRFKKPVELPNDISVANDLDVGNDLEVTGNSILQGDLTVNGTTTTINTETLDVEDTNITVNKNGTDITSEGAGLTIERAGTDGSIVYEDALESKFKAGVLGSEKELVNVDSAQVVANKSIQTPSRSDTKQDTEANLITYASTASDGQFVYATDTQKMYQIIDNALAAVGGGGVGSTSIWNVLQADNQAYDDTDFFDETNLVNANFSEESVSPIGTGEKSYKLVNHASAGNEYLLIGEKANPEFALDRMNVFPFIGKYDEAGTDGAIYVVVEVYNGSTWSERPESKVEVLASGVVENYFPQANIPTDTTLVRLKMVIATGEAYNFVFENITFDADQGVAILSVQEGDSEVRVNYATGYGSTGTMIYTFQNISSEIGEDIEYTSDSVNGDTFVAKTDGMYDMTFTFRHSTSSISGISRNASSLTAFVYDLDTDERLTMDESISGDRKSCSVQKYLNAGDVIRAHGNAIAIGTQPQACDFTMTRVGKLNENHIVLPAEAGSQVAKFEGYTSKTSSRIKFTTLKYDLNSEGETASGDLINPDNTGTYTKFIATKPCWFDATSSVFFASGGGAARIIKYNSSDVELDNAGGGASVGGYNDASRSVAFFKMDAGDYIVVYNDDGITPATSYDWYNQFSVKATPLRANFSYALPTNAEQGSQIAEYRGFTSRNGSLNDAIKFAVNEVDKTYGSALFSHDNTGNYTKFTALEDCYFDVDLAFQWGSANQNKNAYIYHASSSEATIKAYVAYKRDGSYESSAQMSRNIFVSKGEIVYVASPSYDPQNSNNATNVTVTATPLKMNFFIDQMKYNAKESPNNFGARIANNGTATITSQGGKNDAGEYPIATVNTSASGVVDYVFTSGFFTVIPAVTTTATSDDDFNAAITSLTTSGFTVTTTNNTGSKFNVNVDLHFERQGADVRDIYRFVETAAVKVAYINPHATNYNAVNVASTSYVTMPLVNIDSMSDTGFLSIGSNKATLQPGTYITRVNIGTLYDITGYVSFGLWNDTSSSYIKEFKDVIYSNSGINSGTMQLVTVKFKIQVPTEIEYRLKSGIAGNGYMAMSPIEITKIL